MISNLFRGAAALMKRRSDDGEAPPALAILNNKLYGAWIDSESANTGVFKQVTTPTQLWFPNLVNNGSDGGVYETAGCTANEVRAVDGNGYPSFVSSSTLVTLSAGAGLSFYSDSDCTQALPGNQVSIAAGDSGAHFFFMVVSGGASFYYNGRNRLGTHVSEPNDQRSQRRRLDRRGRLQSNVGHERMLEFGKKASTISKCHIQRGSLHHQLFGRDQHQ